MPNPIEVDIETLLQPISADAPSGAYLRYEGTYEKIREARREDDASLPQGVWERALKTADWSTVIALCTEALSRKSKDLQIAVWLGEAWIQKGGLLGFRQIAGLCTGLCDRFWDTLHPSAEDGNADARMNLLDWLDDVAARDLRQIALTEPSGASPGYCLADWEAGIQISAAATRARAATGDAPAPVTHESFLARLSLTGYVGWAALKKEVEDAIALVTQLDGIAAAKVEGASVLRRTGSVLRAIGSIIDEGLKVTKDSAPAGALAEAAKLLGVTAGAGAENGGGGGGTAGGGTAGGGTAGGGASGPITSRTDAYVRLTEAADYLLRTEPHSPVPYLVKRAISWGNMSLAELLYEFVGNTDDLVAIQRLLGMRERE